jgi:hypothetical protein
MGDDVGGRGTTAFQIPNSLCCSYSANFKLMVTCRRSQRLCHSTGMPCSCISLEKMERAIVERKKFSLKSDWWVQAGESEWH